MGLYLLGLGNVRDFPHPPVVAPCGLKLISYMYQFPERHCSNTTKLF